MTLEQRYQLASDLRTMALGSWRIKLPRRSKLARDAFRTSAFMVVDAALADTRSTRTQRRLQELRADIMRDHENSQWSDRTYREQLASRREDSEEWESQGYRVFTHFYSHTYSTSSDPMYTARSAADRVVKDLAKLGYCAHTQCPDFQHRSVRCTYWGGTYSDNCGHIVVLIRVDTPMELELARREYAEFMLQYWRGLQWDVTHRETFNNW